MILSSYTKPTGFYQPSLQTVKYIHFVPILEKILLILLHRAQTFLKFSHCNSEFHNFSWLQWILWPEGIKRCFVSGSHLESFRLFHTLERELHQQAFEADSERSVPSTRSHVKKEPRENSLPYWAQEARLCGALNHCQLSKFLSSYCSSSALNM